MTKASWKGFRDWAVLQGFKLCDGCDAIMTGFFMFPEIRLTSCIFVQSSSKVFVVYGQR